MDFLAEAIVGTVSAITSGYDYLKTGYKFAKSYLSGNAEQNKEADDAFDHAKRTLEGRIDD